MESFSNFIDFKDAVTQYYCDSNSEYEITYTPVLKTWFEMRSSPCFQCVLHVRFERTKKVFDYPMSYPVTLFESLIKDLEDHMKRSYRMNYANKWLRRKE